MNADKARLRRLKLLGRIREIEHRSSAASAFAAVGAGQRSRSLAARAQELAQSYSARSDAALGYDLIAQRLAGQQTGQLAAQTGTQAHHAEARARELLLLEREARHRRDRVQEEFIKQLRTVTAEPLGMNTAASGKDKLGMNGE